VLGIPIQDNDIFLIDAGHHDQDRQVRKTAVTALITI
jgi:hypothetical protein